MSAVRLEVVQAKRQDTGKVKVEFIEGDLASHERFMMLVSALAPISPLHASWPLPDACAVMANTL